MFIKLFSLFTFGIGVFLIVSVIMPIASFKFWELTAFRDSINLVNPFLKEENILGVSIENIGNFPAFISQNKRKEKAPYGEFKISINSIGIFDARVKVDTNNFEENLAHLPGAALPGERGNVFITGHSSLTQFFKPGNYKAIFANLSKVKKGDEVIANVNGQNYTYTILNINIVDPKNISVINPPDNLGRYLTLMTCVPPGLNTKRLVVLAKLK